MAKLPCIPNKNTEIREYPVAAGQTWAAGRPLKTNASGELLVSVDPLDTMLGFSAHPVPMDGVDIYNGKAKVYLAREGSTFWVEGDNAPTDADVLQNYAIDLDTGVAYVNGAGVEDDVRVESIDTYRNLYEISVLETRRQLS